MPNPVQLPKMLGSMDASEAAPARQNENGGFSPRSRSKHSGRSDRLEARGAARNANSEFLQRPMVPVHFLLRPFKTAGLALLVMTLAAIAQEQDAATATPPVHDPSTPVADGGKWWVFSTGIGISTRFSADLETWKNGEPVFREMPEWHREVVPEHRGHLWAPEVIHHQGRFLLYYSVSSFGKNSSAIGLVTNATLDREDPEFGWKDQGIVIRSHSRDSFNAIDPHIFRGEDGRLWMSFGSFWSGIQLIELDPETGLRHPENREQRRIAWHEEIEAPAILRHGDHHYLFVNWGKCCRGVESTYEIRVGRSEKVTGPYLDAEGEDLATGGGTLLLKTEGPRIGPGHASFVERDGTTTMFIHYYDGDRNGRSVLGRHQLGWTEDGWPEIVRP